MNFLLGSFNKYIVIPIYMTDDIRSWNNHYRPITLTVSITKLSEKSVNTKLVYFLNEHIIIIFLNGKQFGFRNKLSTNVALYCNTKLNYNNLDLKKKFLVYF